MKLTKTVIDKICPPLNQDQAFYRDQQLKGFALRITKNGSKSFIVEKLIGGKVKRMTLGRYGELTAEQARKEAIKLLGKIATGIDPVAEKKASRLKIVSLKTTFEDYLNSRKDLKPKSRYDYQRIMYHTAFTSWLNKPLVSISKDNIIQRHAKLGEQRGPAFANLAMRLLRAIFNYAAEQYEDTQGKSLVPDNPVKRLSKTHAWYRIKRRQSYIKPHQLSAWYQALVSLNNDTIRDYLLLILFTGLRRNEAAKLEKQHVDILNKTLQITNTKNHEQHVLPLPDYLCSLLEHRINTSPNQYIFHGGGKGGYLIEPRKQMAKIIDATNIQFTVHDLRRTFITIAESLDISAYSLKRLINHKMEHDITAGYIISDVERLRGPMQKISEYIIQQLTTKS